MIVIKTRRGPETINKTRNFEHVIIESALRSVGACKNRYNIYIAPDWAVPKANSTIWHVNLHSSLPDQTHQSHKHSG